MADIYLFVLVIPRLRTAPLCTAYSRFPTTDEVVKAVRASCPDFDTIEAETVLRHDLPANGLSNLGLGLERADWNGHWKSVEKVLPDGAILSFHKCKLHA